MVTRIDGVSNHIEQGALRDKNLFHSFEQFNIGPSDRTYFTNPEGVERIFSRVTGTDPSDILGTLGILGNADLFFINPNGVIFGPGFNLDVNGSFLVSTADTIGFENGGFFSAREPDNNQLLSVNPNAFFFGDHVNSSRPTTIQVNSATNPDAERLIGAQETLALVGGVIEIDGGILAAPDGRIEIGGVGTNSTVNIITLEQGYDLAYEDVDTFGNVTVQNQGTLHTNGEQGGNIHLQGEQILVKDGALIETNTEGNSGSRSSRALRLHANDLINIDAANIFAIVRASSQSGQTSADIEVESDRLFIRNGAQLGTFVDANALGNGGDVVIRSPLIQLTSSQIASLILADGQGEGGNIRIDTDRLDVTNGSRIATSLFGQGTSGNISIEANEQVEVINRRSVIATDIQGRGKGGVLEINVPKLLIADEGKLSTSIVRGGAGTAGELRINAEEMVISNPDFQGFTGIFTLIIDRAADEFNVAGNIFIDVGRLTMRDGSRIASSVSKLGRSGNINIQAQTIDLSGAALSDSVPAFVTGIVAGIDTTGEGVAGNIDIETDQLILRGGAQIRSLTNGPGQPGNLTIRANDIRLIGSVIGSENITDASGFSVLTDSSSNAGTITVDTDQLLLRNGAAITAQAIANEKTEGATGNPGQIIIEGNAIALNRGIISSAIGEGVRVQSDLDMLGEIFIDANSLVLRNDSEISASTAGVGNAGNIDVEATNWITIASDSRLSVETSSEGNAGRIIIDTPTLTVEFDAAITATATADAAQSSEGGDIFLNASTMDLSGRVGVFSETRGQAPAGRLALAPYRNNPALDITLRNAARVSASTTSEGKGGDLNISAPNSINIQGEGEKPGRITVETTGSGNAGTLRIETGDLYIRDGIVVSARSGRRPESTGNAGDIDIRVDTLALQNGARITARSFGNSLAGNITVNAQDTVSLVNQARILAETENGQQGDISLQGLERLELERSRISAQTQTGRAGRLDIVAANQIVLNRGSILSVEAERTDSNMSETNALQVNNRLKETRNNIGSRADESQANNLPRVAGNLTLNTGTLHVSDGSTIRVSSPDGSAGNVVIESKDILLSNGEISAETGRSVGLRENAANVNLSGVGLLVLQDESLIAAQANAAANGGNITINADDGFIVAKPNNNNDIIATAVEGNGGNIDITTLRLFGLQENSGNFESLQANQTNDMSVTSTLGTSGVISVNDLGLDPVQAAADLPVETASPPLSQGCTPGGGQGNFTNAGQGGVPLGAGDVRGSDRAWEDISPPELTTANHPVTEAQNWTINDRGQVVLQSEPETETVQLTCRS